MAARREGSRSHYVHRTSYTLQERLVGLFVIVAVAGVIGLVLSSQQVAEFFQRDFTLYGVAGNAQGVEPGTEVRISGILVGRVRGVSITDTNEVLIEMHVAPPFRERLREDSTAALGALSLLGSTSVEITPGSPDSPPLESGARIRVASAGSLNDVAARVTPVLVTLEQTVRGVAELVAAVDPERLKTTVDDLGALTGEMRAIATHVRGGGGALGMALYDENFRLDAGEGVAGLAPTLADTRRALAEATRTLAETRARVAEMKPLITDARGVADATREVTEALPGLVNEVELAVSQVNLSLRTLNRDLGELPDLVARMKLLLEDTRRTLAGLQRVWPISAAVQPAEETTVIQARPLDE